MKINTLTTEQVFLSLVTSEHGLSEEEAGRRLREFGLNEISEVKKKHLIARLLGQFTHFLAVLLWFAACLSFLSEYLHPGEGMLTLGIAIIGVVVINAIFTFIQEYRAEKALEALKKLLPFYVKVLREKTEKEIHAGEVVPGDLILLCEGDKVPADARLIETAGLKVNHAPLTGESEPLTRSHEPFPGELMDSPNITFAGTTVISGSGKAIVFATGMKTEFGRIAHLTSAVEAGLSPLQKEIVKATRVVAAIAGAVGLFFFILGFIIGRDFWDNFIFGVGITVALIPEGMLPTVTLALAMGSQRMAKRKALIKTLTSVETLGSVTVICTDKTGTLTQNRMAVAKLWVDGDLIEPGADMTAAPSRLLLTTAALCNNARFVDNEYRGDPTETALLTASRDALGDISAPRLSEIPFDADRKMMTTVHTMDGTAAVFSKGAMERLLPLCSHIMINGERRPIDDNFRDDVIHADHVIMDMGLRVLAFAGKELENREASSAGSEEIEHDLTFFGLIGLQDPPRHEVPEAIRKCHNAGIRIIMITGDGSRTALAIARQIGLVQGTPVIIEGPAFNAMPDRELMEQLIAPQIIFARMTPKHKLRVVSLLKDKGEVVAVTGDGVNDAPALKRADIGISMGIAGTDVAKEASDMVLLDDNFATIVNAVEEGRTVYENIKKFIAYIFASNIPEAVPYLAYILFKIPLPLTILQILAVDLGTDMLPALALGTEKPTPGIMKQAPRKMTERLLNFSLIARAYLFLGPIEATACMFGFFWVLGQGGWTWGIMLPPSDHLYMQATTACLTAIIVTQVTNVFACRSYRESLFSIGFYTNRLIFAGIAVELLLQLFIVYHPFGNKIFSTSPLPWTTWFVLVPFALALLLAEETRKYFVRKKSQ
ncbi:MAG TPA: cation-transporting P-type ATPase [Nitrospirota bacterium]|nr:cation-transporting P-type ATPase [Nitrospirota bacterium]